MPLQSDKANPGHFTDPAELGKAATFAIIIGVSSYPHLEGGDGPPTENSFGLGQLSVSALTAHRFFRWLRQDYSFDSAPLSQCWILTSPTQAEIALEPELASFPEATYRNCAAALLQWEKALHALPVDIAQKSRSIFFFSGHGIERGSDHQILLASDYLTPKAPVVNEAISVYNLYECIGYLPLTAAFYFIDACRAAPDDLSDAGITGTNILLQQAGRTAKVGTSPIMYATRSGYETWQPADPNDGLSIYGQALLAGLAAEKTRNKECPHPPVAHVSYFPLQTFVSNQVRRLLERATGTPVVGLPVQSGGRAADECVTALPARVPKPGVPRRKTRAKASSPRGPARESLSNDSPRAAVEPLDGFDKARARPRDDNLSADSANYGALHDLLGHESLTEMWASSSTVTPFGGHPQITVNSIEPVGKSGWEIEFSVATTTRCWAEFPSFESAYFCELPTVDGINDFPRYSAELKADAHGRPTSLAISLSSANEPSLSRAARMWRKYAEMRPAEALREFDADNLEEMLEEKRISPIAAAIAGSILLRAGRYDRLHDWLRNLSDWYDQLADGSVLWAQHLRESKGWKAEEEPTELVEHFLRLEERGLPSLAATFEYATQIANDLCQYVYPEGRPLPGEREERAERVRRIRDQLTRASRFARPGGMVQVYAAKQRGALDPTLVRPMRQIA